MLRLAFEIGSMVYIGLTSDRMAAESRKKVMPYRTRLAALRRKCSRFGTNFEISELDDPYGYSTRVESLRGIVVSEATSFRVPEINRIRGAAGFAPLESHVVPLIRSFNGLPLSSTRILSGECDTRGRLLAPLRVGVGSRNRVKVMAVRDAFTLFGKEIGRARFTACECGTGVPEQPVEGETQRGAVERARNSIRENDLGIGIEAGLFESKELGAVYDVQYCVIIDRAGRMTSGHGMGFAYPPSVIRDVAGGESIGTVMSRISGISDVGRKRGAIGYLSKGKISRRQLTVQAVIAALIPRINPSLYQDTAMRSQSPVLRIDRNRPPGGLE